MLYNAKSSQVILDDALMDYLSFINTGSISTKNK